MKELTSYVNESEVKTLHSHISQYLKDLSLQNDEESIRIIYNTCRVLVNRKVLDPIFKEKKLSFFSNNIINIIEKFGDVSEFITRVKNPINFRQLFDESNIYKFTENDIPFWKKIAECTGYEKGKVAGKYEILLTLLLDDAKRGVIGDINVGGNNIEIKGAESRCNPGGAIQPPSVIDDKLNELLSTTDLSITHSQKYIKNTWLYCKNHNIQLTPEVLGEAMMSQWEFLLNDSAFSNALSHWVSFLKTIKISTEDSGKIMQRLYGILSIYCYSLVKKFDYLMCLNADGDYILMKSFYKVSNNNIVNYLNKLYNNEKLVVVSLPQLNDERSVVPKIKTVIGRNPKDMNYN